MKLNTGPKIIDLGDGVLCEADVYRIVEQVRAYDPNLDIIALNPNHRDIDLTDAPYVLVEKCKDGQWRPVSEFWVLDERVMQVVESADMNRRDLLAAIDGQNAKARAAEARRYEDFREEVKDIVKHIGGMKSKYTVQDPRTGEHIAFYDDRPPERTAK